MTADEEPSNEETEVNVEKMDWNPEKKSRFKKYKKDLGYFRNQVTCMIGCLAEKYM